MKHILNAINKVPMWEKSVIITLVIIPIPFTVETYLMVRTMYKKMKNNSEK